MTIISTLDANVALSFNAALENVFRRCYASLHSLNPSSESSGKSKRSRLKLNINSAGVEQKIGENNFNFLPHNENLIRVDMGKIVYTKS